ncbi:GIY-YIG nuclease family protein [Peribacillus frigoritolerans]|uniref:GIY-YIG nuclease family protein n=1 Tax=Peribacillus frigoritolerans TaxID=450367 RepID=UPI0034E071B2
MKKGTKLGRRDYWQTYINYNEREAYKAFEKFQLLKKKLDLKKQLADLEQLNEASQQELKEISKEIELYERIYRRHLKDYEMWSFRQVYGRKNLGFIAPYIEKHGEKAGFIYILRALEEKHMYKVGKTRSLFSRTNSYNSQIPMEFVLIQHTEECDLVERLLLDLFKEKRIKGYEWFLLTDEDIERIKKYFKHCIQK